MNLVKAIWNNGNKFLKKCPGGLIALAFVLSFFPLGHADPIPPNRKIDWSHAGIPGGIPTNYTFFCDVTVNIPGTNIVAYGNGVSNDTAALNAAISLATNNSYIYLPAGIYRTTGTLNISRKHIILRGAGSSNTVISNTASGGDAIKIYQSTIAAASGNNILSGATEGSTRITLDGYIPSVDTWYYIGSDSDPGDIIRDGCSDGASYLHKNRQIVKVTDVTAGVVTFTPALRWDLSTNTAWIAPASYSSSANKCGVENLAVCFSQAGSQRSLICFSAVQECWVTGCELSWTRNNAVELRNATHCQIQSNIIHHAWDYVGGWGYGVWEFDCAGDNLIENNIFYNVRHAYASEGFVTGSVIAYNYETNECFRSQAGTPENSMSGSFITHAVGAKYLLFEGNVCDKFNMDNVHGSGLKNTIFRNRVYPHTANDDFPSGNITYGTIAISVQKHNNFINVVGNVLGIAGLTTIYEGNTTNSPPAAYANTIYMLGYSCDNLSGGGAVSDCMTNLLRAVNWDTATGTTISDAGVDTNLPDSYYLSAKPSWWGDGAWPAIGPDLTPMTSEIPAQERYKRTVGRSAPMPPSSLSVFSSGK